MSLDRKGFDDHLKTGLTTVCRAWDVVRADGVTYGFTDHDLDLVFAGITYKADTGLSASALQQTTGLSIDNSEAVGAISSLSITADDIDSGRFDGAEVRAWQVNWQVPDQRALLFKGSIGEIKRRDGLFHAELRGLAEKLNQPMGRVYQRQSTARLRDELPLEVLNSPSFSVETMVQAFEDCRYLTVSQDLDYPDGWFERGECHILDGKALATQCLIKSDKRANNGRVLELWEPLHRGLDIGDRVKLYAGYDGSVEQCKLKFNNIVNFQGFPHIPGEDWLISFPTKNANNDGGSLMS